MGKLLKIFLLYVLLFFALASVSAAIDPKCHRSTEGKEFWFGFMEGRNTSNHYVEVTVTSRFSASFNIYIGKSTTPFNTIPYTISANSSLQIRFNPASLVEPAGSEVVLEKAIHLVADNPVNVYALNHDNNSSDVAVIFPVESLGNEYFAMCYTPRIQTNNNVITGRNTEFVIVASQDNTSVLITPTVFTDQGKPSGTPFTVKLSKGELYQVQSMNSAADKKQGDLTGSYIIADKPIAVFSGSLSTTIPYETPSGGWDHLYEQMPPVKTWGREYYTVPLQGRSKDYFRIMAAQDNTTIQVGNNVPFTLNKGAFSEITLNSSVRIASDKPILVSQYSQSKSNDGVVNGDGFMLILSSVSQAKNDVTFVAYQSTLMKVYYVNIVVPISEIGNIELAGNRMPPNSFTPYSNGKYAWAQRPISPGEWRLRNAVNADRGFIAYVYGFGGNEAFGYGVGFNLDLVLDLGKGINFIGDTISICQGESLKLDAGPYFDFYKWDNIKDTIQEISVTSQAKYSLTASTIDGCLQRDSIFVLVSNPKTNIGNDKSDCYPYSVVLDGSGGNKFSGYEWSTGEISKTVVVNKTGDYWVKAVDKYGCPARDTMKLTVYPVPKVDLTGNQLYCGDKSGLADLKITGTDESVWKQGSFKWETDKPAILSINNASFTQTGFSVSGYGNFKIFNTLTTVNGCIVKDTLSVGLFQIPTSKITTADPGQCGEYNRNILYSGNATSKSSFYWDYGGLALIKDIDWKTKQVSLGAVNSNPFVSLYVEENGCKSDTTRLPVGANPNFSMDTKPSQRCDTATIIFTGKLNVPDSQLQFAWNFGDGTPEGTQQTSSHFYKAPGSYDVSLLITNRVTGCKAGFTVEDMVKVFQTPTASIAADPAVCNKDTIQVIFPLNNDASICLWTFDGAHKIGSGNDTIRVVLDKPTATIQLKVNEFGCISKQVEKQVTRKPHFDFITEAEQGCQPLTVYVEAKPADNNLEFTWITDSNRVAGNRKIITVYKPGKVNVKLAGYSTETGCRDTLTKSNFIWVHPKPTASFDVDYPAATIENPTIKFFNKSMLADNFIWDFGDKTTATEKNVSHTYKQVGEFPVELIAISGYGCSDTTMLPILIVPVVVYAPNAFSPAAENPNDRVFMPVSKGILPGNLHIVIFNRWGQVVFESRSTENPWDGKLKNDSDAPMGGYIWVAEFDDIQGFKHKEKGSVYLVR